jgi:parallel beta-helix repeat protein
MNLFLPGKMIAGAVALLTGLLVVACMLLVTQRSDASVRLGPVAHGSIPIESGVATLPSLADALATRGEDHLLVQQDGWWELTRTIVVQRGATLDMQGVNLRLVSGTPTGAIEANGGTVEIDHATVTSWDRSRRAPDTAPSDGRPWILAHNGSRMDVTDSSLSRLGYNAYGRYGVSWRTHAHGAVSGSTFDGNYYGLYTFQANPMIISRSVVSHSVVYGLDLHTGSDGFRIDHNRFSDNGKHGLTLAVDCTHAVIRRNVAYGNRHHGFVLFAGSNDALVQGNEAFDNGGSGLDVSGSKQVTIQGNVLHENTVGLSIHDRSSGELLRGNRISGNRTDGVHLSSGAGAIRMEANLVDFNQRAGVFVDDGSIKIGAGNKLNDNLDGLWLASGANRISVQKSQVVESVNDGIYLTTGSAAITIRGNLLSNSGKAAFSTSAAGQAAPFLRDNRLVGNELPTRVRGR